MDLPWEIFERVARTFPEVEHVHLQGWGEPLLHPRLFEMIALAKSAGCRVGLTTNGMRLDPGTSRRLLEVGLDLLSVSIAGATREVHERIRVGSDFSLILENVRALVALRAERRSGGPKVELSYLMTQSNIGELPDAVDLAVSLGVDELYATNLDYAVTPAHDQRRVFGRPALREGFSRTADEARGRARRAHLTFRPYPLDLEEVAVCEAHPTKILFVSCDGWVAPCTYLSLPGQREIPRWFEGRQVMVPVPRFGNLQDQDLMEIWEGRALCEFRRRFVQREMVAATGALFAAAGGVDPGADLPPPPEPCVSCYKLYGV